MRANRAFVDTNVLLYADDRGADRKRDVARRLIDQLSSERPVISTQVMQEYFARATTKLRHSPADAKKRLELLLAWEVVVLHPPLILEAVALQERARLSFWDALIVKAAASAGCKRLLTEDLQHGQTIDGVKIENPFLGL